MARILIAASECVPFSKSGGLADVVGSLAQGLVRIGHQVSVFLPRYRSTFLTSSNVVIPSITIPFETGNRYCSILDGGQRESVQYYFVDYPQFFDREVLYGTALGDYPDNAERFALFSRAVLEAAKIIGTPEVIHCHDWQTALIPILLNTVYRADPAYTRIPSIFTIHNLGYQGIFPPEVLPLLMLPWDLFTVPKLEFYGKVNLLKGAIEAADYLTTVSEKYAQEIQTAEYGFGLEDVLRARSTSLVGILNGFDYADWDPATDKMLVANYSVQDLAGKNSCKRDLLMEFGLNVDSRSPIIGIVSRFASQKGFNLIEQISNRMALEDLTVIALGTGDHDYEEMFRRLNKQYPLKFAVKIGFDNVLAHKIEAGADMFLMPSKYEPAGLNQLYSMKYGTVPIVRATGGLDDSVQQFDPVAGTGTGFKFREYSGDALLDAIRTAIRVFHDRDKWRILMRNGMLQDHSWAAAAVKYARVYNLAISSRCESAVSMI